MSPFVNQILQNCLKKRSCLVSDKHCTTMVFFGRFKPEDPKTEGMIATARMNALGRDLNLSSSLLFDCLLYRSQEHDVYVLIFLKLHRRILNFF